MNPSKGGWVVALSILLAMLATVVHLPENWPNWLGWLRPNWLLVVLFFWVMELPERIGLIAAWIIGLFTDALLAQPLGLNAFLFASFTYFTWSFFERLRMFSVLQQGGVLFLLVLTVEIVRELVAEFGGTAQGISWGVLSIALISALVWPVIYLILLRVRIIARVE